MPFKPLGLRKQPKEKIKEGQVAKKKQVEDELVTLEEEKVYRVGVVSIRDLIAPSAFRVESNFVQLGNTFCVHFLWLPIHDI